MVMAMPELPPQR